MYLVVYFLILQGRTISHPTPLCHYYNTSLKNFKVKKLITCVNIVLRQKIPLRHLPKSSINGIVFDFLKSEEAALLYAEQNFTVGSVGNNAIELTAANLRLSRNKHRKRTV